MRLTKRGWLGLRSMDSFMMGPGTLLVPVLCRGSPLRQTFARRSHQARIRLDRPDPPIQAAPLQPLSRIQNNSDLAQGPHPIRPSKVLRSDICLAPGVVHGTETKTS